MTIRLVCIGDTHSLHWHMTVPEGDILIHAGDLTNVGDIRDVYDFNDFLGELPHPYKIVIAGNHDFCFESDSQRCRKILTNAVYLQDEAVTLHGITFYGSPWQPEFQEWSFNLPRGKALKEKWDMIPNDTDVLITHGPPADTLDSVRGDNLPLGCVDLKEAVERVRPSLHVFGHIHSAYGIRRRWNTTYVNCSLVGDHNTIRENHPVVFDYFKT